jgi:hypothetical protein
MATPPAAKRPSVLEVCRVNTKRGKLRKGQLAASKDQWQTKTVPQFGKKLAEKSGKLATSAAAALRKCRRPRPMAD